MNLIVLILIISSAVIYVGITIATIVSSVCYDTRTHESSADHAGSIIYDIIKAILWPLTLLVWILTILPKLILWVIKIIPKIPRIVAKVIVGIAKSLKRDFIRNEDIV